MRARRQQPVPAAPRQTGQTYQSQQAPQTRPNSQLQQRRQPPHQQRHPTQQQPRPYQPQQQPQQQQQQQYSRQQQQSRSQPQQQFHQQPDFAQQQPQPQHYGNPSYNSNQPDSRPAPKNKISVSDAICRLSLRLGYVEEKLMEYMQHLENSVEHSTSSNLKDYADEFSGFITPSSNDTECAINDKNNFDNNFQTHPATNVDGVVGEVEVDDELKSNTFVSTELLHHDLEIHGDSANDSHMPL